jgi:hypothetical protein
VSERAGDLDPVTGRERHDVADVDARLDCALGAAKVRRLRALLEELGAVWS